MISFRIAGHQLRPAHQIVEVLLDGHVVAVIYPSEDSIGIISAHMANVSQSDGSGENPPIPSVSITFKPRPYRIEGGKLVYLE